MKRAIFVVSHKGGSGKSTFARGLLDIMRASGKTVAALDADGDVGQLLQYYGTRDADGKLTRPQSPTEGILPFDIRDDKQVDNLINILDTECDSILVDMPGGTTGRLNDAQPGGVAALAREYEQEGYKITVVIVMSNISASANNVKKTIAMLGDSVDYVAVKNLFYGDADEFAIYDGFTDAKKRQIGGTGKAMLAEIGGINIDMPKIRSKEYSYLDMYNLTFSAAVSDERFLRAEKSVIFNWMYLFNESLKPAAEKLGL